MYSLYRALESRLAPVAADAGFVFVECSRSDTAEGSEDAWLEYRAAYADRRILLDICQVAARRTVSATLWSPTDLARAVPDAEVNTIAIREHTWHYEAPADCNALTDEIVAEVTAWLEQSPWDGTAT